MEQPQRTIQQIVTGQQTMDGAGVTLRRYIPFPGGNQVDPFLLLDVFKSDNPGDYIAGFPTHPHRGFETVTYLLAGKMRHHDSAGHSGTVESGGVQWMTAGRGIEHSEIPEQEDGLLHGFQLWVNLPAAQKMRPPRYQELCSDEIPIERQQGVVIRVIAGKTDQGTQGPVTAISAQPTFMDITVERGHSWTQTLPLHHNAFVYLIEGQCRIGGEPLEAGEMGILTPGESLQLEATNHCQLLLVSGTPFHEPVVRHGPFVMNSSEEIATALRDYQQGRFGMGNP